MQAAGTFEVKVVPLGEAGAVPGRMSIDKEFSGDLEATSSGQMLTAGGNVKGSAGYVAMEIVEGTLGGRRGSFVLQHSGTMNRGVPALIVSVVPDSGSAELVGLSGQMTIDITAGKHLYTLEYAIAAE